MNKDMHKLSYVAKTAVTFLTLDLSQLQNTRQDLEEIFENVQEQLVRRNGAPLVDFCLFRLRTNGKSVR